MYNLNLIVIVHLFDWIFSKSHFIINLGREIFGISRTIYEIFLNLIRNYSVLILTKLFIIQFQFTFLC